MPKFTVLIIEDEKNIQTFVGKILKKQDYRVLYADCGKEGLNLIHSQCPDVIILDLGLPDMNGNDIIQEVRTSVQSQTRFSLHKRESSDFRSFPHCFPNPEFPASVLPVLFPFHLQTESVLFLL